MAVPITYSIQAGERLSTLLAQLNDRLGSFASYRATRKSTLLDCTPGAWTGGERTRFDDAYSVQQQLLKDYADVALRAKAQVDTANQTFYQLRSSNAPKE